MPDPREDQIFQSWFSPAYPVGAFSYSHGLEQVISEGSVVDSAGLMDWIADILRHGAGRTDGILLYAAAMPGADAQALSDLAAALAPSRERHLETMAQGEAFARTTSDVWGTDATPRVYPVAVGIAVAALGLSPARAVRLYLHAFSANLVSAAVRYMPLGQTDGQKCLAALLPVIEEVAAEAAKSTPDEIGNATMAADIAAMHHETLPTRIFRT
ncbi:urease accessory protein UreF [Algicella marina]|uniref:Urease accessory protein UreF n=1 Tax=Algicella marina TaxID=2683284 RepID=A0A6P1T403_9RHOB|nr:urease accessory protein UreF [Algicella marina]QHQ37478.1 urease accessory protein UreF [Algicella marina]